jgi:RNA polymerase sigma-70 factor, ECF subfamily
MGTFQASPFEVRPAARVPRLPVTRRKARPQEIDSRGLTQPSPKTNETSLHTSSESAMVRQAIAGNADACELLFATRTSRLIGTAFSVLRNREDAEDAVQDGLFQAYSKLHSFEGRSSFSSWLTRIVINAALMTRRRKSARPQLSLDEILESQAERYPRGAVDPRSDPEKIYAAKEIQALIEGQVRKLPQELRQAYRLRAINGLSAAESGRVLGIPSSRYKSRLFHARRKLTNALRESDSRVRCEPAHARMSPSGPR